MKSSIIFALLAMIFMVTTFNFDFIYRLFYNTCIYSGHINDYEFKLEDKWELCDSNEEGFYSYFTYDFKKIIFCNDSGNTFEIFSWESPGLAELKPFVTKKGVEFKFVRFIKEEDRIILFHEESKTALSTSPSTNVNELLSIRYLDPDK